MDNKKLFFQSSLLSMLFNKAKNKPHENPYRFSSTSTQESSLLETVFLDNR